MDRTVHIFAVLTSAGLIIVLLMSLLRHWWRSEAPCPQCHGSGIGEHHEGMGAGYDDPCPACGGSGATQQEIPQ